MRRRAQAAGEGRGAGGRAVRGPERGQAPGWRGRRGGRRRRRQGCSPPGPAAGSCCRAASWLIAPGRRSVWPARARGWVAGRLRAEPVTPPGRAWCRRGQGAGGLGAGAGRRALRGFLSAPPGAARTAGSSPLCQLGASPVAAPSPCRARPLQRLRGLLPGLRMLRRHAGASGAGTRGAERGRGGARRGRESRPRERARGGFGCGC
jgi:hypothetical protein